MYRKFFKRIFDLILAIIALPFWLIILIIIGPIIYFQDKGPVFYNAPRLGKDGKIFKMYKFRTMKMNAPDIRNEDGSTFNSEDDPRLTKVGKFIRKTSIDESPQIINVIKGDMSIIGPRPDLPDQRNIYIGDEIRKLEVVPGITGYNQVYFRNSIPVRERFINDIYYVNNINFLLDFKIVLLTAKVLFQRKNVFNNSKVIKKSDHSTIDA